MKNYILSKLGHLGGIAGIKKIQGEASNRCFFRVNQGKHSMVAMVYPSENREEIERISRLTDVYKNHKLQVPSIRETIDNRIILLEDLGDLSIQKAFARSGATEKKKLLGLISSILASLASIPSSHTAASLDTARMKWEMDFFIEHFVPHYCSPKTDTDGLRLKLHGMVEAIVHTDTFAHRDFHSRNMLLYKEGVYLVDFQDSLKAPVYYDLVSFAFDAYLDLKSLAVFFKDTVKADGIRLDEEQFLLTALERNIKALGTFGYQVSVRKNLAYKKYMARTIRHIHGNPLFGSLLKGHLEFEL
ncbi:MAG: phosphotransferase [bacterium]|nr:phosphotransferase [bacterium]